MSLAASNSISVPSNQTVLISLNEIISMIFLVSVSSSHKLSYNWPAIKYESIVSKQNYKLLFYMSSGLSPKGYFERGAFEAYWGNRHGTLIEIIVLVISFYTPSEMVVEHLSYV